jgi:hypothetical protein
VLGQLFGRQGYYDGDGDGGGGDVNDQARAVTEVT